jgi:hypothetical protein
MAELQRFFYLRQARRSGVSDRRSLKGASNWNSHSEYRAGGDIKAETWGPLTKRQGGRHLHQDHSVKMGLWLKAG